MVDIQTDTHIQIHGHTGRHWDPLTGTQIGTQRHTYRQSQFDVTSHRQKQTYRNTKTDTQIETDEHTDRSRETRIRRQGAHSGFNGNRWTDKGGFAGDSISLSESSKGKVISVYRPTQCKSRGEWQREKEREREREKERERERYS